MTKFGATGTYPDGKMHESDEGGIDIGIARDGDNVVIVFGTPVKWLGLPPDKAIEFANLILNHANSLKNH